MVAGVEPSPWAAGLAASVPACVPDGPAPELEAASRELEVWGWFPELAAGPLPHASNHEAALTASNDPNLRMNHFPSMAKPKAPILLLAQKMMVYLQLIRDQGPRAIPRPKQSRAAAHACGRAAVPSRRLDVFRSERARRTGPRNDEVFRRSG